MSFVNPQSCCPPNIPPNLTCADDSVTVCQGTTPWIVQAQGVEATARDLTCILDSVTVCQGANVWTVEIGAASLFALETVTVFQGTSPWVVSGTVAATQSGVWTVNVVEPVTVDGTVSLSAGTLAALETVTVLQGTSPWVVSGAVTVSNFPASQVVTAVDLDIRNLTCTTDSVTICPGADPIPVTFSGTISVALDCATDSVTICPGVDPIPVTQSGVWTTGRTWDLNFAVDQVDASGSIVALDGPTLAALETITVIQGTSPWVVSGAVTVSNFPASQVVTAVDLDIRNLDCLTDSVTVCVVDPLPVAPSISPYTTDAQTVAAVGPTAIVTPSAGNRLRIRWLFAQSGALNIGAVVVTFRLNATIIYRFELDAGQPFAHTTIVEGAADEVLTVELSNTNSVFINVDYEEV